MVRSRSRKAVGESPCEFESRPLRNLTPTLISMECHLKPPFSQMNRLAVCIQMCLCVKISVGIDIFVNL